MKYLGHIITSVMTDNDDIERQVRSLYVSGHMLKRSFFMCSDIVKRRLFTAYLNNLYCCPLWINYSRNVYGKLKVALNNCFRLLFNVKGRCSISQKFVEKHLTTFDALVRRSIFSFKSRVTNSRNLILSSIFESDVKHVSCFMGAWHQKLFLV